MIIGDVEAVINWLQLNNCKAFFLGAQKGSRASNDNFFISEDGAPIEQEYERLRKVMELTENDIMYVTCVRSENPSRNNLTEKWKNTSARQKISGTEEPAQPQFNPYDPDLIDQKISMAIMTERMSWERKELERSRKELERERREFRQDKESILGIAVQKFAPVIKGMFPKVAVAGVDGTVTAQPIQAAQSGTDEDEPLDQETNDKIEMLINDWMQADPDFMQVLEKIVHFAKTGEKINLGIMQAGYAEFKNLLLS